MNSSDYLTKTDIMLMGGEPIDILMTANYAQYTVRAMSGSYLPLDDFMKEEGITAEDAYNVILKVNDQTYGIPGEMKYNLVLINKNMLDEAGLEVPALDWTWDDYHEYAKKLTSEAEQTPNTVPISIPGATATYGESAAVRMEALILMMMRH